MNRKKTKIEKKVMLSGNRRARNAHPTALRRAVVRILKVFAFLCVLAGAGAAIYFAQDYVVAGHPAVMGPLVLVSVPKWVNEPLQQKVVEAAGADRFPLDQNTPALLVQRLAQMAWLDEVRVLVTNTDVRLSAKWRKPIAVLRDGLTEFYVDADGVVLAVVPMPHLPIIAVKGVPIVGRPQPGLPMDREDLRAALELLVLLGRMDAKLAPERGLLQEIESIDVRNFDGRQNPHEPHIVLWARDNTQIIWGAKIGDWTRQLEAKDEHKLARLYSYYRQYGTLLGGAKYINLRDPEDQVPQPIDKYQ